MHHPVCVFDSRVLKFELACSRNRQQQIFKIIAENNSLRHPVFKVDNYVVYNVGTCCRDEDVSYGLNC
jgi:hypothetical protein